MRRPTSTKPAGSRILIYSNNNNNKENNNNNNKLDDFEYRQATKTVGLSKHRKLSSNSNNTSKNSNRLVNQKGSSSNLEEDDEAKDFSELFSKATTNHGMCTWTLFLITTLCLIKLL